MHIESAAATGRITAQIEFASDRGPSTLLLRLRHPKEKPVRSVTVDGAMGFDSAKEWVRVASPNVPRYNITATY